MWEDQTLALSVFLLFSHAHQSHGPLEMDTVQPQQRLASRPTPVCTRQEQKEADARGLTGTSGHIFIIF